MFLTRKIAAVAVVAVVVGLATTGCSGREADIAPPPSPPLVTILVADPARAFNPRCQTVPERAGTLTWTQAEDSHTSQPPDGVRKGAQVRARPNADRSGWWMSIDGAAEAEVSEGTFRAAWGASCHRTLWVLTEPLTAETSEAKPAQRTLARDTALAVTMAMIRPDGELWYWFKTQYDEFKVPDRQEAFSVRERDLNSAGSRVHLALYAPLVGDRAGNPGCETVIGDADRPLHWRQAQEVHAQLRTVPSGARVRADPGWLVTFDDTVIRANQDTVETLFRASCQRQLYLLHDPLTAHASADRIHPVRFQAGDELVVVGATRSQGGELWLKVQADHLAAYHVPAADLTRTATRQK